MLEGFGFGFLVAGSRLGFLVADSRLRLVLLAISWDGAKGDAALGEGVGGWW